MRPEEPQDREVHPDVHQSEGIAGRGDGVEVRDPCEVTAVNHDAGPVPGAPNLFFRGVLALASDGLGVRWAWWMRNEFVRSRA